MKKTKSLVIKDLEHLSKLANLKLKPVEKKSLLSQLDNTLSYIKNLAELDISKVTITSHTSVKKNAFFIDGTPNSRKLTKDTIFNNTKNKKGDYFMVRRINLM